jgi:hypothetical protein
MFVRHFPPGLIAKFRHLVKRVITSEASWGRRSSPSHPLSSEASWAAGPVSLIHFLPRLPASRAARHWPAVCPGSLARPAGRPVTAGSLSRLSSPKCGSGPSGPAVCPGPPPRNAAAARQGRPSVLAILPGLRQRSAQGRPSFPARRAARPGPSGSPRSPPRPEAAARPWPPGSPRSPPRPSAAARPGPVVCPGYLPRPAEASRPGPAGRLSELSSPDSGGVRPLPLPSPGSGSPRATVRPGAGGRREGLEIRDLGGLECLIAYSGTLSAIRRGGRENTFSKEGLYI